MKTQNKCLGNTWFGYFTSESVESVEQEQYGADANHPS